MTTPVDFELIAVTRDLVRHPETRFLASVLYHIATGAVDNNPAPIYVMLAHKIINHPGAYTTLAHALEITRK